jgi:hypothetical protein
VATADGLADFVRGLPEGQRHKGFFWAAVPAVEDGLPPGEVAKVAKAGIDAGLDEAYVKRTLAKVQGT